MSAIKTIDHDEPRAVAAMTPMDMLSQALGNGASMEVMEKLFALQERWEANQGRKAFDEAMAAAKAEIPVINKNRTVDFTSSKGRTNYRHEDLAEIARVVNPILGRHGLSYRFRTTSNVNEPVSVTCIVTHRQGHSEENTLSAGRDDSGSKNNIQAVGSTLTYLQRMTLKASLGLAASDDDDGHSAGGEDHGAIDEDQVAKLRELIDETGSDIEKFCRFMKVEAIPQIQARDFDRAVKSLEFKRGRT